MTARDDARDRRGDEIEALVNEGLTSSQIAKVIGVDRRTVAWHRNRRGITAPPRQFATPEQIEKLEMLLADGTSATEAARTVGVNPGTVRNVYRGKGWTNAQSISYLTALRKHGQVLSRFRRGWWS